MSTLSIPNHTDAIQDSVCQCKSLSLANPLYLLIGIPTVFFLCIHHVLSFMASAIGLLFEAPSGTLSLPATSSIEAFSCETNSGRDRRSYGGITLWQHGLMKYVEAESVRRSYAGRPYSPERSCQLGPALSVRDPSPPRGIGAASAAGRPQAGPC